MCWYCLLHCVLFTAGIHMWRWESVHEITGNNNPAPTSGWGFGPTLHPSCCRHISIPADVQDCGGDSVPAASWTQFCSVVKGLYITHTVLRKPDRVMMDTHIYLNPNVLSWIIIDGLKAQSWWGWDFPGCPNWLWGPPLPLPVQWAQQPEHVADHPPYFSAG